MNLTRIAAVVHGESEATEKLIRLIEGEEPNAEEIEQLLKLSKELDVNATMEDRKTVLHWAAEKGQLEIIKQLFKKMWT
jgi:ankyrin repeat protein